MVRKAFQGRVFLRDCCRFSPGTAYIVGAARRLARTDGSDGSDCVVGFVIVCVEFIICAGLFLCPIIEVCL